MVTSCQGESITLTAPTGVSYLWTTGETTVSITVNPMVSTTYTVSVTDADGCMTVVITDAIVQAAPLARAGSNAPICLGTDLLLTETGDNAVSWVWSGPNSFTSTDQDPIISGASLGATGIYTVTVTDANGCTALAETQVTIGSEDMDNDGLCDIADPDPTSACVPDPSFCTLYLNVLLEGPYITATGLMNTALNDNGLLPLAQPYNDVPWNYNGTESVAAIPPNVVDWILVEARDAADNTIILETRAVFLMSNGDVRDLDGTLGVHLNTIPANTDYFVVVRHRNHLDVLSASLIPFPNIVPYDFTEPSNVSGGLIQLKDLGSGDYGLLAGDFDGNGVVTVADFNLYSTQASLLNIYVLSDCNLDKAVTVADFNHYSGNASAIGVTEIRY